MGEEGLDLIGLWRVIIKRWHLIVVLPVLAAVVIYLHGYYNYSPVYSTSSTMMVARPASITPATSSDIHASRQMVATYTEIVLSRRILNEVAKDQMIPYSADQLRGKLQVEGVNGTELILITATDPDAVMASYVANMVAYVFMEEIGDVIMGAYVSILDEAPVPQGPANPMASQRNMILAAMIGLIAAVSLAFMIDYTDQSIKETGEAERLLNLPVLGVVPEVKETGDFTIKGRSPQAEALRTLRTNIQFTSIDRPIKSILVTGAKPNCGKSTISANLANTFAQTGSRVLLIDADLRKPVQHRLFKIESKEGLSSLIFNSEIRLEDVLHASGRDSLKVMTCGPIPPYPVEMLSSQKMKELVDMLKQRFDYIIFDSPPVLAVTDAIVLSTLTDGTLMVLDHGQVRRDEAADAIKALRRAQAKVIGLVLNAVPYSSDHYKGYKYYYSTNGRKKGKEKPGVWKRICRAASKVGLQ